MAKAQLTCRVCGKRYEACLSERYNGVFRWQDVACSPECGDEYLNRILVSRGLLDKETSDDADASPVYNEEYYGFDGEPDDEYEDDFGSE